LSSLAQLRRIYRYDNFPDSNWFSVKTFPAHFHDGDQDTVVAAPFSVTPERGFREFMAFVQGQVRL
jgi:creatinine amidohydrolase/Fe(II)-dependent formamide hydrolase-like protein